MDLFERIKAIIVRELGVDADRVTIDARFKEDLEADSLDLVELIMAFEDEFGGEISDDEAQKIKTVRQAVDYLGSGWQPANSHSHHFHAGASTALAAGKGAGR